MKHVVERCPRCGVEHEAPGDGTCEACGDALRPWCRVHGPASGWLDGPACPRCAEEAARPRPLPCPAPALPVTMCAAAPPRTGPRARVGVRAGARGAAPVERDAPPPPVLVRVGIGVVTALTTGFGFWLFGLAAGFIHAFMTDATYHAVPSWGRAAGMAGLLAGSMKALRYVVPPSAGSKK